MDINETTGKVYQPSKKNLVAGCILCLIMIAIGIFGVYHTHNSIPAPPNNTPVKIKENKEISIFFMVFMTLASFALLYYVRKISLIKTILTEEGLVQNIGGKWDVTLWKDINQVEEFITPVSITVVKVPGGKMHSTVHNIHIYRNALPKISFSVNRIENIDELKEDLKYFTSKNKIQWFTADHRP